MTMLTKPAIREIIDDFAKEIAQRKTKGPRPAKTVIDFRNERRDGIERDIYYVPIDLLRYRKNNGRISSDILHYEKSHGLLDEKTKETQQIIKCFLEGKDKEKTDELLRSMGHDGQRNPAIITCDGFLINGNRRKMVMEMLEKKYPGDAKFNLMKVVILPGKTDEGGPPSLVEIEQIENRYQLQSEAKAEYYAFDRALSIRRKIELGMSLEEQLRDDPIFAGLDDKTFKKEAKKCENEYLKPLECIDRYLRHLSREGLYHTVSTGLGDPEGRWQAFRDYYHFVYQKLEDDRKRFQLGISEDEVGKIEDVAFKIIRKREFQGLPKVHKIVRDLPKWLANKESKKELLKLTDTNLRLTQAESIDAKGVEYDERTLDKMWGEKHAARIIKIVKDAKNSYDFTKEKETPLNLLDAALKRLNHERMDPANVNVSDYPKAMKIAREIQERANELESEFYQWQKKYKELLRKYKK